MGGNSTTNINSLTACHMQSGGISTAEPPDVCLTLGPSGSPVPLPYVNSAMSLDLIEGSQSVLIDDSPVALLTSKFAKSTGDEPGVIGGVMSGTNMSMAEFTTGSPNVCIEGEPVCRLSDKMSMNNGNTVTSAGLMQAPLPPVQPLTGAFDPDQPQVCTLRRLTVKCSHSERNYVADTEKAHLVKMAVIATSKPEKVKISYDHQCAIHPEGCAKFWVLAPWGEKRPFEQTVPGSKRTDETLEFALATDYARYAAGKQESLAEIRTWYELFQAIFGSWFEGRDLRSSMPHTRYTIYGTTCQATKEAMFITGEFVRLDVYPGWSLNAEVSLGYKHDEVKLPKGQPPIGPQLKQQLEKQAKWELGGKVDGFIAAHRFEAKWSKEGDSAKSDSDPLSSKLFAITQGTLNRLANTLGSFAGLESTKFKIRWPNMTLGGSLKLAENKDDGDVFPEGRFYIGAEPLLGTQISVDILDWLIVACATGVFPFGGAAFGRGLGRIKAQLQKGLQLGPSEVKTKAGLKEVKQPVNLKGDFGIVFTMGGDVGGALGWVFDAEGVHPDGDKSKIEAAIDLKLEAYIKLELKVFIVKAAAGASVAVQSADGKSPSRISGVIRQNPARKRGAKPKSGNYFDLTGQIEFNGLAIHYSLYLEIAGGGNEATGADAAEPPPEELPHKSSKSLKIEEGGELCKLLDPWVLPQSDENIFRAL